MNDAYSELLIKKETTVKDRLIKVLVIAVIVLAVLAGFMQPLAWLLALGAGIGAYFLFPNLDLEFEYVYVNGELDIDKIMSKMKRKKNVISKMKRIKKKVK